MKSSELEPKLLYSWFRALIFGSSFLLFSVQPILGKYILPWFGGAPAVWITALLFFQSALVIGYLAAYILSRLQARIQFIVFILLAILGILTLPIIPEQILGGDPIVTILQMLLLAVGLPYTVLAASSPLLQYLTGISGNTKPYKLYAWSNFGSLLGLLSYPILIEPLLSVEVQAMTWSALYGLLVVGFILLALKLKRHLGSLVPRTKEQRSKLSDIFWWVSISAAASTMLLGVTNYITQDIASVPLLWIIPLAIYLFAFILTFQNEHFYDRTFFLIMFLLFSFLGAGVIWLGSSFSNVLQLSITLLMLFIFCIVCDGELYSLKPDASRLTSYYLWISLGGALGGVCVALIAPLIFPFYFELHAGIIITLILITSLMLLRRKDLINHLSKKLRVLFYFIPIVSVAIILISAVNVSAGPTFVTRDFFGSIRIYEKATHKMLYHGHTVHGMQFLDPKLECWPTTYYGYTSGLGKLMELYDKNDASIGVVGLGAGTAAVYADTVRYYEISPSVIDAAERDFTYLSNCTENATVQAGDARQSLGQESSQQFDVLVLDAFSSDAIPVHLLTEEAFAIYERHVSPDGSIAIHISNKYLDFAPLIRGIAEHTGLHHAIIEDEGESIKGTAASTWAILSNNRSTIEQLKEKGYVSQSEETGTSVFWTDARSNIFSLFRLF